MTYVVEGIFLVETEATNPRDAQIQARKLLSCENAKLYVVNAWEKKEEDEPEDEF
mgnify:CR=1 FL=1